MSSAAKSRFSFKDNFPAEVGKVVRAAFTLEEWLIPGWCQTVHVNWIGEGHEAAALEIKVDYDGRWAWIDVYPAWLDGDDTQRREQIIHELLHVSVNLLWNYAREAIETLLKEDAPRFHAVADKELRTRMESCVQDLAFLIQRKIPPA